MVDEVLDGTSDIIIVCTTLGGKTGTKYAPLISLNAILRGKFVCNVFSMPYKFEGTAKNNLASAAWHLMMCTANLTFQQYNDGLVHVENLMMGEMDKPLPKLNVNNFLTIWHKLTPNLIHRWYNFAA